MFTSPNVLITVFAVMFSMVFISFGVWYVNKLFSNTTQDVLVRFILMVFAALVGVFVVDKVVAFKVNLLSEEQNTQLFDLIKTLTLMIFSYYFGSKTNERDNKLK
jgi:hypothetical protein